jgi:N-acetyldiaminopimelate deacetylase
MKQSEDFINTRRELHQIPELGFQEEQTQEYLMKMIKKLPQERLEIKTWKTGILVKVNGTNPTKTIGYRTDIDGLPIREETNDEFKSRHDGNMHACGHDVHMSIALGVLSYFAHAPVQENLLFIFQPAEEGPGGALPMLQSEAFKAWKPDEIFALHISPELPVGTVATKEGLLFANTSELYIGLKGEGGHAAFPHQANDMVVAASYLVTQLQSVIARNVNPLDSAVVTIGKIDGGTKQNIIAGDARIEGTIRTLSLDSMKQVKERIETIVQGIGKSFSCETEIDYGSNYRAVDNDPAIMNEFISFCEKFPDICFQPCDVAMTGEDFGYFLEEIPGGMFWLGVDADHGLHSSKLQPDENAIPTAIHLLTEFLTYKTSRPAAME